MIRPSVRLTKVAHRRNIFKNPIRLIFDNFNTSRILTLHARCETDAIIFICKANSQIRRFCKYFSMHLPRDSYGNTEEITSPNDDMVSKRCQIKSEPLTVYNWACHCRAGRFRGRPSIRRRRGCPGAFFAMESRRFKVGDEINR
jgi:hypothetical protein